MSDPSKFPYYCDLFHDSFLTNAKSMLSFIRVDPFVVWVVPMGIKPLNGTMSVLGCTS